MKISSSIPLSIIILILAFFISCREDSNDEEIIDVVNTDTPPNIIFIIADDLGWDAYGDYPGITATKANTPTIDSLARNGITFTNFWVNPICAPTRASMLTGKYGFRTGVGGVQTPPTAILSSTETIIQKYINDTSDEYATALIGKWHVSQSSQLNAPEYFGIGFFSGIFLGAILNYYNWTQTSGGSQQNITTYATTHLVDQSVNWIEQQTKPFFLWLAFNAPHTPFHRPPLDLITDQSLVDNQATINANPLPYYLASIEAMDTEIARLISSLTPAQKENTVFVFMGDNGTPREVTQTPYADNGSKGTLFQGGINAPLVFCGKGVTRQNVTESALVQGADMFATLADLTDAGSDDYQDGVSMKPLLSDANATKRTFVYSEQFDNTSTKNDGYAIRNETYKLLHLENGTEYLFKISTDPFEQTNLMTATLSAEAQENLDQLRQLKAGL
ncbi:MAG: arylsulfatase A-like enzyme [Marinoscillum sp.]|jgi:arylsulfatase A-like enzyme